MPDELAFHPEALREWRTLSTGIREPFKKKLAKRLIEPRIPASKLRGSSPRHIIKLLRAGFRLIDAVRHRKRTTLLTVGATQILKQLGSLANDVPLQRP